MRVLAVPVKSLEGAKGRLAPLLAPIERAALTLAMLEDVLDATAGQSGWETWVVSPDEAVLEVAVRRGATAFVEPPGTGSAGLLRAIGAVEAALHGRSSALAVLLADLPLLTAAALAVALEPADRAAVVAGPAGSDGGTNLLVRRPPGVITARFGRRSFAKHRWAAGRAGASFIPVDVPELAFDLDRPDDVARFLAAERPGRTRSVCLDLALDERVRLRA